MRLIVNNNKRQFELMMDGNQRIAKFPPSGDSFSLLSWPTFLSAIVSATGRPKDVTSGEDDWWELEIEPSKLRDISGPEISQFSLRRLDDSPFTAENFHTHLYWEVDHHGTRDSEGHAPESGDPLAIGEADLIWLGGSANDDHFDLYEELYECTTRGREHGFATTGRWTGRFTTNPKEGEYKVQFYVTANFKRPSFGNMDWN